MFAFVYLCVHIHFFSVHFSFCCRLHVNLQEYIFVQRTLNFAFHLVCGFFVFAFYIIL